jgi:2-amino-1-hydroxyethylphosphonate dioxygenase (glycine-forming)
MKAENSYREIVKLFNLHGNGDYIGEAVSQKEHALQCAFFAMEKGHDSELILASLFHDIGHICADPSAPTMDHLGVVDHQKIGADYLENLGFSTKISILVNGHVKAKRYLCYKNSNYYKNLSEASRGTLAHQGGPMSEEEASQFITDPHFTEILQLRIFDEMGKVKDFKVPDLDFYKNMISDNINSNLLNN